MEKIWLNNYAPNVPQTINADTYPSLVELFEKQVKQYGHANAFSNLGVSLSFKKLEEESRAFAVYLQRELGLVKGERVAIMLPNLLQYPIVLFGILRAGLIVVNVNPLYTASELKHQLKDSEAVAIIVLENFAATLSEALPETFIRHVIISKVGDYLGIKGVGINFFLKYLLRKIPAYKISKPIFLKPAIERGYQLNFIRVSLSGEDIAFLQYTGGTTGVSKGAVLTHRNMIANILQCSAWLGSSLEIGKELAIGALPFYHIFALTICSLCFMTLGVECLLISNPRQLNDFVRTLIKNSPTIFVGVNTLFNGLLNHKHFRKINFSGLKLTVAGGMAVQKVVADKWQAATGCFILEGYGLTEASPVVSINPLNLKNFNGSVGLPIPSTDIKICADDGDELAVMSEGELYVKGPQVMRAYWNNAAETAKVLDDQGWLRTGDIAKVDEKGFIHIVDRKKDMILVSGFNVYPNEVEAAIMQHPAVKEVAVIGVTDGHTGEAVKAFIVKQENKTLTPQEIITHCQHFLTHYKIPKQIEFCDVLPKSNVGKVLRRELRETH